MGSFDAIATNLVDRTPAADTRRHASSSSVVSGGASGDTDTGKANANANANANAVTTESAAKTPRVTGNDTLDAYVDSLLSGATGASSGSSTQFNMQFTYEYQCLRLVSDATGGTLTETSFQYSFSASIHCASGSAGASDVNDLMAKLQEMFSPEKTASRIADFALAQYAPGVGGDTEEARASFVDFIGKYVQKGFDEASRILGKMPSTTEDTVQRTHELVFSTFDSFIKNGAGADRAERSTSIMAYYEQFNQTYSFTETAGNGLTYNIYGATSSSSASASFLDASA